MTLFLQSPCVQMGNHWAKEKVHIEHSAGDGIITRLLG